MESMAALPPTSSLERTSREILSVRVMIAIAQDVERNLCNDLRTKGLQYNGPEVPPPPGAVADTGNYHIRFDQIITD